MILSVSVLGISYPICNNAISFSAAMLAMASGRNGDDGDMLLFRDGPGAGDVSAGTLRLFISWECSRPVAGVKVSLSSGNWVAGEVGESILLGMECPAAASCSGELLGVLDFKHWRKSRQLFIRSVVFMENEFALMPCIEDRVVNRKRIQWIAADAIC
ncbi:hypothetical protein Tco_1065502 [Tanacetum coccineum]